MYKRTVRCRYCGNTGHTYVTCSSLKEYVSKNPNSYWTHKLAVREDSNKNRKCSWCQNTGHNKKTCHVLMEDKVKVASNNINFRKAFIENVIKKNGIGIGALLNIKKTSGYVGNDFRYDLEDEMALVTDIDLNKVMFLGGDGRILSSIKIELLRVNEYQSNKRATSFIDIPNWYVLGKDKPNNNHRYWERKNFDVVCHGWYDVENEESWLREASAVNSIIEKYDNHMRLEHAISKYHEDT